MYEKASKTIENSVLIREFVVFFTENIENKIFIILFQILRQKQTTDTVILVIRMDNYVKVVGHPRYF